MEYRGAQLRCEGCLGWMDDAGQSGWVCKTPGCKNAWPESFPWSPSAPKSEPSVPPIQSASVAPMVANDGTTDVHLRNDSEELAVVTVPGTFPDLPGLIEWRGRFFDSPTLSYSAPMQVTYFQVTAYRISD